MLLLSLEELGRDPNPGSLGPAEASDERCDLLNSASMRELSVTLLGRGWAPCDDADRI
jgi:hypothetical protein